MRKQRCASGRPDRGENPESSKQLSEDYNEPRHDRMTTAASAAPPSPTGPPPTLTAQQRARLHELLQQRDAQGRVTYQLDKYTTNASMWAAYRVALKTSYRNHFKQPRAMGTWSRIKPGGPTRHARETALLDHADNASALPCPDDRKTEGHPSPDGDKPQAETVRPTISRRSSTEGSERSERGDYRAPGGNHHFVLRVRAGRKVLSISGCAGLHVSINSFNVISCRRGVNP